MEQLGAGALFVLVSSVFAEGEVAAVRLGGRDRDAGGAQHLGLATFLFERDVIGVARLVPGSERPAGRRLGLAADVVGVFA